MFKRGPYWWTCIRYKGRKIQKSLETSDKKLAVKIETKVMTQRYAHHCPESLRAGVAILDKVDYNLTTMSGKQAVLDG
jgi:hypothetical protein